MTDNSRYDMVARWVHWLMAALILTNIVLALVADDADKALRKELFFWHISFGVLLLELAVFRLVWALTHPAPAYGEQVSPRDIRVHKIVAHSLYLLMLLVPLAGYLMVDSAGGQASFFGWYALPDLLDKSKETHELWEDVHVFLAWTLAALAALHAAAGIRHRMLKDGVFERMTLGQAGGKD